MLKKVLCLALFLTACFSNLLAQDCDTALEDALESFGQRDYIRIITFMTDCPPELLVDKTQKIMAYDLLLQAYFVTGQVDSAKGSLNSLLDLQPDYAPQPPLYSEKFIGMVEQVRKERVQGESASIFHNKWFWVGGVAASSVAAFLIFGGSGDPALLPEAPDPPGGR